MKSSGEVKLFLFITIGALALGGVVFIPSLLAKPPGPEGPVVMPPKISRQFLVPAGSHIKGDPKAPFSIVEFSDFQCTHCKDAQPKMEVLLSRYKPKVNLVYRHFQAVPSHIHASTLAYAAEAAGNQGKFFEMTDRIFSNQDHYDAADANEIRGMVTRMAESLGLDVKRFQKDMDSAAVRTTVKRDSDNAVDANVDGTPTFFFVTPSNKVTKLSRPADLIAHVQDPKNWQ